MHTVLTEWNIEGARAVEAIAPGAVMELYQIDPVRDPRWSELLENHPRASIFHTAGWLEALRRTYGYEPIAYTSSPPGGKSGTGSYFAVSIAG